MRKLVIFIIALIVALPLSMIATITIHPLWKWFENATGIESYGSILLMKKSASESIEQGIERDANIREGLIGQARSRPYGEKCWLAWPDPILILDQKSTVVTRYAVGVYFVNCNNLFEEFLPVLLPPGMRKLQAGQIFLIWVMS